MIRSQIHSKEDSVLGGSSRHAELIQRLANEEEQCIRQNNKTVNSPFTSNYIKTIDEHIHQSEKLRNNVTIDAAP
jgi:hypothetical protein